MPLARLRRKKERLPSDKYAYDIANTLLSIAQLKRAEGNPLSFLIDTLLNRDAARHFRAVSTDDPNHYSRARTYPTGASPCRNIAQYFRYTDRIIVVRLLFFARLIVNE